MRESSGRNPVSPGFPGCQDPHFPRFLGSLCFQATTPTASPITLDDALAILADWATGRRPDPRWRHLTPFDPDFRPRSGVRACSNGTVAVRHRDRGAIPARSAPQASTDADTPPPEEREHGSISCDTGRVAMARLGGANAVSFWSGTPIDDRRHSETLWHRLVDGCRHSLRRADNERAPRVRAGAGHVHRHDGHVRGAASPRRSPASSA